MIVMNEAESSILVHSKPEVNPQTVTDYLKAIQSCGQQNLVVEQSLPEKKT